jgi:hypothetical protein
VLTSEAIRAWADTIHTMPNVTLHILVAPEADVTPQSGKTVLTAINGQPVTGVHNQEWWR